MFEKSGIIQTTIMGNIQNTNQASCNTLLLESFKVHFNKGCRYLNISGLSLVHTSNKQIHNVHMYEVTELADYSA